MTDLRQRRPRLLPLRSLLAALGLSGAAPAAPTADASRAQAQSVADASVETLRRRSEPAGERFRQLPPSPPPTPSRLLPPLPPPEAIRRSPPPASATSRSTCASRVGAASQPRLTGMGHGKDTRPSLLDLLPVVPMPAAPLPTNRSFGILFTVVFALAGGYLWWTHLVGHGWFLGAAALTLLVALTVPDWLAPFIAPEYFL